MKRPTFNEINITPLTDIFLVLLIIMMVIAPMLDQQGLKLAIPEYVEQNQQDNKETKILTVMIDENNNYYIDGVQTDSKNLSKIIKDKSKILPDGLMIEVAGNSEHESVVKLMDIARNSGITAISITEI